MTGTGTGRARLETAAVETSLAEAAAMASWPATPALRAGVLGRIESRAMISAPPLTGRRTSLRVIGPIALALVALLLLGGVVAAALGLRLPGLDILFVDRLPPAGTGLELGSPVPMGTAVAVDRPRVLVPASLPTPDTAFVLGAGDHRIVTLAYRATDGQATLPGSDLALTIMAVPGDTDEVFLSKLLGPGTTIEPVTIGGSRGWWIAGAPHDILVRHPDGSAGVLTSSLAGDTLLFVRGQTLYRLESALGRDATITIAESMR